MLRMRLMARFSAVKKLLARCLQQTSVRIERESMETNRNIFFSVKHYRPSVMNIRKSVFIDVQHIALRNNIIMENIVNSLDTEDLDSWYEFCTKFEFHDVTNMDRICWKKRAEKLAETLGMTHSLAEKWPKKTFRDIHAILSHDATQVTRIRGMLAKEEILDSEDIAEAARLAHEGLLGPLTGWRLILCRVDLFSVPTAHLASLVSSVTSKIAIFEVYGDLINILDNVKSKEMDIIGQNLSKEETRALVQAMETRVNEVSLGVGEEVNLDIGTLTDYSGYGECYQVTSSHSLQEYRDELRSWARDRNWSTILDDNDNHLKNAISIERN